MNVLIINDYIGSTVFSVYKEDGTKLETITLNIDTIHFKKQTKIELIQAHKIKKENIIQF